MRMDLFVILTARLAQVNKAEELNATGGSLVSKQNVYKRHSQHYLYARRPI